MKKLIQQNPLFYAFFFPALINGILTLVGQGEKYWGGSRIVNEASPVTVGEAVVG